MLEGDWVLSPLPWFSRLAAVVFSYKDKASDCLRSYEDVTELTFTRGLVAQALAISGSKNITKDLQGRRLPSYGLAAWGRPC